MSGRPTPPARPRDPGPSVWPVRGQPLQDDSLRGRIGEALGRVSEQVGHPVVEDPDELRSFAGAERLLDLAFDRVDKALDQAEQLVITDTRALVAMQRELAALQRELGAAELAHRSRAFGLVQASLARLRSVTSIDRMIDLIPAEVCRCGFSRAIISRVREGVWVTEACYVEGDPAWAADVVRVGQEQPQRLDHAILETEMIRRRGAIMVRGVQSDTRVHRAIAETSMSHSYVAAPLMPKGRVIGFIHADCHVTPREIDEFDRDVLWMLAEGLGYAFERTVLSERQRALQQRVLQATESIGEIIGEYVDADVEVARLELDTAVAVRTAAAPFIAPESRLYTLLTRREIEVARLMVNGRTNPQIAAELVIAEATVKSHVSQILRKLRAANRAEAVSKYMRLAGADMPP
ncbi:MAG TPA: LuxR C-terminal-related transcriptional regulator [Solirubrobacteraceae bacterium]|jgi:DNA-binding CsgD family transcriptional regulator|nr:LuxR C-terminal-related transcriptional regulator [Solirubrobacteraceae bacterium]